MSMFHELMMRKKEQIMYATIKGTLTENNGVFSGFSASNYLQIQSLNVSITNWELVLNIKSNATTAFLETKNRDILIRQYSATHISIFMSSQGNTTYDIASNLLVPLTISTNAWLKISFTGSSYVFSVSYDGINYEVKQTISSSSQIQNLFNSNYIKLGYSSYIGSAYNGEINLNRSSIKLGSTKYKLQAVVGYTKVGSPTIVDGVVSGFTTSDYLTLGARTLNLENIVFHTKFKTGTLQSNETYTIFMFGNYGSAYPIGFLIQNKRFRLFYAGNANSGNANSATTYFLDDNTEYEVEFGTKNSKRYCKFGLAGNMTDFTLGSGSDTDFVGSVEKYIWLGVVGTNYNWALTVGSIDLNSTYIKENNKLWFNGQQA